MQTLVFKGCSFVTAYFKKVWTYMTWYVTLVLIPVICAAVIVWYFTITRSFHILLFYNQCCGTGTGTGTGTVGTVTFWLVEPEP